MRVEGTALPAGVITTEKMMMNNPCRVGDEVTLKKGKSSDYDYCFNAKEKVNVRCVGVHRFFINFSDGLKIYSIHKADIANGAIKIELVR